MAPLVDHLSEPALNRQRIHVEIEWLIHLTDREVVPGVRRSPTTRRPRLRRIVDGLRAGRDRRDGRDRAGHPARRQGGRVLPQEAPRRDRPGDEDTGLAELIHFCCTSEDINNLSYALMVQGAVEEVWLPRASRARRGARRRWPPTCATVPLLSHTHGQPATPSTLGKELAVLAWRLQRQLRRVEDAEFLGKLNGATGTYGAHLAAVPEADWEEVSETFVEGLGLTWNPLTTQIESHDWQAELYADIARFNRVLHNLCTDVWTYISMGYFAQVRGQGTVGCSTMPHKVNPIRFENAEANLEVSNALLDVLASTLVQSRLQRDLTDSSMQRNIGVALGHSLLALDNATRGLAGLDAVPAAMERDLDANWEVLGEPIQSAMRALGAQGVPGMEEPYERLKELTRGRRIGQPELVEFVRGLGLPGRGRGAPRRHDAADLRRHRARARRPPRLSQRSQTDHTTKRPAGPWSVRGAFGMPGVRLRR